MNNVQIATSTVKFAVSTLSFATSTLSAFSASTTSSASTFAADAEIPGAPRGFEERRQRRQHILPLKIQTKSYKELLDRTISYIKIYLSADADAADVLRQATPHKGSQRRHFTEIGVDAADVHKLIN